MKITRKRMLALGAAALTTVSLLASVAPAQAADFSVTADKTSGLALTGQVVNVTVSDLPAATGIYIRLCAGTLAEVTKARPTACAPTASTVWVSNNPVALAQGGKALTGPVALPVPATFASGETTVDCAKVACGIAVRRDHLGGATDFSLDRFIPVTFGAAAVVVKSGVALASSKVTINVVNQKGKKITFFVGSKKFTRVATSDNYIFSAPAPKAEWFIASAYVGAKKIVAKKFN
jgi:hypothetical protein